MDNLRNFTGDNIVRDIIGDFIEDKKGDILRDFSHNLYNFADFTVTVRTV